MKKNNNILEILFKERKKHEKNRNIAADNINNIVNDIIVRKQRKRAGHISGN